MPRQNLTHLKKPRRRFSPKRAAPHPENGSTFETEEFCQREDLLRARMLARVQSDLIDPGRAAELVHALQYSQRDETCPKSLACSSYMRDIRDRVGGAFWELTRQHEITTFTLIPLGWCVSANDFGAFKLAKKMKAIRSILYRAGAKDADGFLVALIHGEFEPESETYQMHLHGIVSGGMKDVLERLRPRLQGKGIKRRLVIDKPPLNYLPYPLTYTIKAYWPKRRIGPVGDEGKIGRTRRGQRIAEPFHSQHLLWLAQHDLDKISLLMKISVIQGRLTPAV